jgi:integrase
VLPRGLKCDRGFLCIRIKNPKYFKGCGPHTRQNEVYAIDDLAQVRRDIRLGVFVQKLKEKRRKFEDVVYKVYLPRWEAERNPDGSPKHKHKAIQNQKSMIKVSLIPWFGKMYFDEIKAKNVLEWREWRMKNEVIGTSVNREQAVLSPIFNSVERWVKTEMIDPFKLPVENPCQYVEKAKLRKRKRVLSTTELKSIKEQAYALGDPDLWTIIKYALTSTLRKSDLERLEVGLEIDLTQNKTGYPINLPITVLTNLNWTNFRKRWELVREKAKLDFPKEDPRNVEFRDLRRTGANILKQRGYSTKIIGEVLGHQNESTTTIYLTPQKEHLKPVVDELKSIVDAI